MSRLYKLEVVPITWHEHQRAKGATYPEIDAGTRVWAIWHQDSNQFFKFAYPEEWAAEKAMDNLVSHPYRKIDFANEPRSVVMPFRVGPKEKKEDGPSG